MTTALVTPRVGVSLELATIRPSLRPAGPAIIATRGRGETRQGCRDSVGCLYVACHILVLVSGVASHH